MFLLITGASGAGKSTVRRAIERALGDQITAVELADVVPIPAVPDVAWRQQTIEVIVQRALELQAEGRHLLLCGDPVPPGELLAVPSAPLLKSIAVCLLDVTPEAQRARLVGRGYDEITLDHHAAFADWMREHCRDPQHLPVVITNNCWDKMRWERWKDWQRGDPRWNFAEIETSELSADEVAKRAVDWCESVLKSNTP